MKTYLEDRIPAILLFFVAFLFVNLYFGVICATRVNISDLLYLDVIGTVLAVTVFLADYRKYRRLCRTLACEQDIPKEEIKKLLGHQPYEIWCRRKEADEEKIQSLYNEILELSDYITLWAHEVKLPLSALRLMNERNQDRVLQEEMRDSLERIQQYLNTMLMSSKLKKPENDIKLEKVSLKEAAAEAVKNHSYFLIRHNFAIEMHRKDIAVYTDRRWLVYMLDQMIGNAVKYRGETPALTFGAETASPGSTDFWIQDNGCGISGEELPYIFDKGFIGSSQRNGSYRSTGMGLYFVKQTADRLGIGIRASSWENNTRFTFTFQNDAEHFFLEEAEQTLQKC
ncbi:MULTISPECIES: sensor histidine kinase [Blautia]|uniref:sensor histidine kinase n=1 Tax=Blautia TaxID=572511 RepID=UPI000BA467A9|nr:MULTISPECIES: sensor histidine kinase [Blautia]